MQKAIEILTHDTGNVYVVGDIHGCYDTLMLKLNSLNFDFENDLLVSVGDLVDRGEKNVECVNLIKNKWFKAVLGNHDLMSIEGKTCIHSYNCHIQNGGTWLYSLPENEQVKITQLLNTLPLVIEVNHKGKKYGIIHADIPLNDWDSLVQELLNFNNLDDDKKERLINMCTWSRMRANGRNINNRIANVDKVFFGHTVQDKMVVMDNCYFIDTGHVFYKNIDSLTVIKL